MNDKKQSLQLHILYALALRPSFFGYAKIYPGWNVNIASTFSVWEAGNGPRKFWTARFQSHLQSTWYLFQTERVDTTTVDGVGHLHIIGVIGHFHDITLWCIQTEGLQSTDSWSSPRVLERSLWWHVGETRGSSSDPRHPGEYLLRWTVFDRYVLGVQIPWQEVLGCLGWPGFWPTPLGWRVLFSWDWIVDVAYWNLWHTWPYVCLRYWLS